MPTYYGLNTGEKINPTKIAQGQFLNEEDGAILLRKRHWDGPPGKTLLVLTGYHQERVLIGKVVTLIADQSGKNLGEYVVVGSVAWDAQDVFHGEVPNRMEKHYVMK